MVQHHAGSTNVGSTVEITRMIAMRWSKTTSSAAQRPAHSQSTTSAPRRRAPLMMSLEPRFMFDGAAAVSHAEGVHAFANHGHMGHLLDHLRPVEAAASTPASGPAVIF